MTALYVTPDVGSQARRRLLLISYHFPPIPVSGARRWEKLAHYVADRGWGMDVITQREHPITAESDLARLKKLPSGIRIYGVPHPTLTLQCVEQTVWLFLRGRRQAGVTTATTKASTGGDGGTSSGAGSSLSLAREHIQWSLHKPRGYFRAYWAWLDFAQGRAWGRPVEQLACEIVQPDVHFAVVNSGPPPPT